MIVMVPVDNAAKLGIRPIVSAEEALAALVMLGFTQQMSQKALKKLFEVQPDITVEQAIRQALKMM